VARGTHFGTQCWVEAGDALATDVGAVIDAFLVLAARIRLAKVHLSLTSRTGVADGADALEFAHAVQAGPAVSARIRFAFVVLEIAIAATESRLAEAAVAVGLVDADAVDAGRRVAAGQLLLAVQSDVAGGTAAVRPLVVGDHATAAVVTHQTVARVELLLAELALVTWQAEAAEEVVAVLLDADADAVVLARIVSAQVRRTAELVHVHRLAARTLETPHGGCCVADAVVGALVAIAAIGRLDRHFHFQTLAAPTHRTPEEVVVVDGEQRRRQRDDPRT